MSAISDAGIVGLTLCLLLGAVAYYLYTRISQLERKVGLMENILLDLKVTTEQTLMSVGEVDSEPLGGSSSLMSGSTEGNSNFMSDHQHITIPVQEEFLPISSNANDVKEVKVEEQTRTKAATPQVQVEREHPVVPSITVTSSSVQINYEAMTYKELVILGRQHGITGVRNMTKAQLIDALKGTSSNNKAEDTFQPLELTSTKANAEERILSLDEVSGNFGGASSLQEVDIDASFVQSS